MAEGSGARQFRFESVKKPVAPRKFGEPKPLFGSDNESVGAGAATEMSDEGAQQQQPSAARPAEYARPDGATQLQLMRSAQRTLGVAARPMVKVSSKADPQFDLVRQSISALHSRQRSKASSMAQIRQRLADCDVRLKEHEAHVAALKLEVLAEEAVSRAQQALLQETVARTDSLAGAIEQCRATASATAMDAAALADASSLEEARVQSADVCGRVHAAESDVELLEQRLASARGAASAQAAKVQQAEGDADALRKSIQCVGERSQEMEQRIVMAEQLLLQLCEITAVSKSHTATVLTSSDAARVDVLREETRMAALRDAVDACRAQIGQAGQMRVARRSQAKELERQLADLRLSYESLGAAKAQALALDAEHKARSERVVALVAAAAVADVQGSELDDALARAEAAVRAHLAEQASFHTASVSAELAARYAELESLHRLGAAQQARLAELQASLGALERTTAQGDIEVASLSVRAEDDAAELDGYLQAWSSELKSAQCDVDQARECARVLTQDNEHSEVQLAALEAAERVANEELTARQKELRDLQAQLAHLQGNAAQLQQQIDAEASAMSTVALQEARAKVEAKAGELERLRHAHAHDLRSLAERLSSALRDATDKAEASALNEAERQFEVALQQRKAECEREGAEKRQLLSNLRADLTRHGEMRSVAAGAAASKSSASASPRARATVAVPMDSGGGAAAAAPSGSAASSSLPRTAAPPPDSILDKRTAERTAGSARTGHKSGSVTGSKKRDDRGASSQPKLAKPALAQARKHPSGASATIISSSARDIARPPKAGAGVAERSAADDARQRVGDKAREERAPASAPVLASQSSWDPFEFMPSQGEVTAKPIARPAKRRSAGASQARRSSSKSQPPRSNRASHGSSVSSSWFDEGL